MLLLVTGGSGYLGSEIARLALGLGHAVETRRVEVRDARAVGAAVRELAPDAVVHTAYRQDTPDEWSTNVDGSRNVARATRRMGARLVHVSTDVVFDGRKGAPYVEEDEVCPVTAYGRSKAEAERLVAVEHPHALIVRTSLIYGGERPGRHELAALDPANTFFTDELRSPIQVGDLAAALLELAQDDTAGPLHVAGADGVSRCEFARLLAGPAVRCGPSTVPRPLDCRLDSSRARALLRTRLRGVREVLAARTNAA